MTKMDILWETIGKLCKTQSWQVSQGRFQLLSVIQLRVATMWILFFTGYGHHSGYHQEHHYGPKCEEIEQKSCYNQPKAVEAVKTLVLVLPEPKKKCTPKTLKVPKVSCHTQTENVCIKVPKITQKPVTVKKCVPKIAGEKCDHIELVLPKQICKDLIVGDAHPVPKYPQHHYSN